MSPTRLLILLLWMLGCSGSANKPVSRSIEPSGATSKAIVAPVSASAPAGSSQQRLERIASLPGLAAELAADDSYIYALIVDGLSGSIVRISVGGGNAQTIAKIAGSGTESDFHLVIDAGHIYWSTNEMDPENRDPISIMRMKADGSAQARVALIPRASSVRSRMVVADAALYFVGLDRKLWRLPAGADKPVLLLTPKEYVPQLRSSGHRLVWLEGTGPAAILAVGTDGRTVNKLGVTQVPGGLATNDQGDTFWTDSVKRADGSRDGQVWRASSASGNVEKLAGGLTWPSDLVVTRQHLYVMIEDHRGIARVPVAGGEVVQVVDDLISAIASHGESVYFATYGQRMELWRIATPTK